MFCCFPAIHTALLSFSIHRHTHTHNLTSSLSHPLSSLSQLLPNTYTVPLTLLLIRYLTTLTLSASKSLSFTQSLFFHSVPSNSIILWSLTLSRSSFLSLFSSVYLFHSVIAVNMSVGLCLCVFLSPCCAPMLPCVGVHACACTYMFLSVCVCVFVSFFIWCCWWYICLHVAIWVSLQAKAFHQFYEPRISVNLFIFCNVTFLIGIQAGMGCFQSVLVFVMEKTEQSIGRPKVFKRVHLFT